MTTFESADRPLIVGAGPVGLGAALFLAREGVGARIIDQAERPSRQSKAIGLVRCADGSDGASATLQHQIGEQETLTCPWLLAADGARGVIRDQLKVDFQGTTFDKLWHLADVPLSTKLPVDRAHIFFPDEGALLFMLRVVDDRRAEPSGDPLWRVMGNVPDPLARLPQGRVTGAPVWTSGFRISHRINSAMRVGTSTLPAMRLISTRPWARGG